MLLVVDDDGVDDDGVDDDHDAGSKRSKKSPSRLLVELDIEDNNDDDDFLQVGETEKHRRKGKKGSIKNLSRNWRISMDATVFAK